VCFQPIIVLELWLELAAFVLQDPDPDQIPGNVVLSRQAVQTLAGQKLLGDLTLEADVE